MSDSTPTSDADTTALGLPGVPSASRMPPAAPPADGGEPDSHPSGRESDPADPADITDDITDDDDGDEKRGNPEAAKWRRKLRDAEAERDAVAARLAAAEDTVIGYALGRAGIDPRLWELSNVDVDELRTEAGQLDIARVIDRATAIRTEVYGHGPRPNPQQGTPSAARNPTGLAAAFDPRNR